MTMRLKFMAFLVAASPAAEACSMGNLYPAMLLVLMLGSVVPMLMSVLAGTAAAPRGAGGAAARSSALWGLGLGWG